MTDHRKVCVMLDGSMPSALSGIHSNSGFIYYKKLELFYASGLQNFSLLIEVLSLCLSGKVVLALPPSNY